MNQLEFRDENACDINVVESNFFEEGIITILKDGKPRTFTNYHPKSTSPTIPRGLIKSLINS